GRRGDQATGGDDLPLFAGGAADRGFGAPTERGHGPDRAGHDRRQLLHFATGGVGPAIAERRGEPERAGRPAPGDDRELQGLGPSPWLGRVTTAPCRNSWTSSPTRRTSAC